jgi:hypothetical protein
MRYQIYSITLLIILIFNIFRFELPYLEYVVFKSYIAKNLCVNKNTPKSCCQGKCFREKQLKIVNSTHETENTNQKNSNKIPQIKETKEFLQSHTLLPRATEFSYLPPTQIETLIESRYVSSLFIPPQF